MESNPIEHRVFPHVTRAMSGVVINNPEEAKNLISLAKTKTGLKVTANIIKKSYKKSKEVAKDFMENMNKALHRNLWVNIA